MGANMRLRKAVSQIFSCLKHPVLALKVNVLVVSGQNDPHIGSIKLNLHFKM